MFARIAAFGALALLLTVPAASAFGPAESPLACATPMQAQPYFGPAAQVQNNLDNLAGCTYHTHDAAALPALPLRVLFVPYLPLPELALNQPSADFSLHCLLLRDEPTGEPHVQVYQGGNCLARARPAEPGPEPLAYHARLSSEYPPKADGSVSTHDLVLFLVQPFVSTMPAGADESSLVQFFVPMYCAQVYPYSLVCSVPATAVQTVETLLKA